VSNAATLLAEVERIHDEDPQRGLAVLREVKPGELDGDGARSYLFYCAHVQGELCGDWAAAHAMAGNALVDLTESPAAALRHAAVCALMADDVSAFESLSRRMASAADASALTAETVVRLNALSMSVKARGPEWVAQAVLDLLNQPGVADAPASKLDAGFGAGFNNLTNALLESLPASGVTAVRRAAIRRCAQLSRQYWLRAGTWVNHQIADYVIAHAHNLLGEPQPAADAARRGLAIIESQATAEEPAATDRAFLLMELAIAQKALADPQFATSRRDAQALMAAETNAAVRADFDKHLARLDA
jgi:hypothetical protein